MAFYTLPSYLHMLHEPHLPYCTKTPHPDLENYHILRLSCPAPGIAWAVPWKCDITTVLGKPIDQWDKDINVAYNMAESCASAVCVCVICICISTYISLFLSLSLHPSLSPYLWSISGSLSALCSCWGWKGSGEQIQHDAKSKMTWKT